MTLNAEHYPRDLDEQLYDKFAKWHTNIAFFLEQLENRTRLVFYARNVDSICMKRSSVESIEAAGAAL